MQDTVLKTLCGILLIDQSGFTRTNESAIVPSMIDVTEKSVATQNQADKVDLVALLRKIAAKDRQAFERFYDSTVKQIYYCAIRFTQKHETAEEVVSDVYMQIWRQASRYEPTRGNVLAWLTIICRSRALDLLRRNASNVRYPELAKIELTVEEQSTELQPQDILLSAERNSSLYYALDKLDGNQRQLLSLAYFRGYSHSELASFTGIPIGTVKTQLRRTVDQLKVFMSRDDSEGGSGE